MIFLMDYHFLANWHLVTDELTIGITELPSNPVINVLMTGPQSFPINTRFPINTFIYLFMPHKYLVLTFHNNQKIILKLGPCFEVCFDGFEVLTAFQTVLSVFHRSQKILRDGKKTLLIWDVESSAAIFQIDLVWILDILL